ncbi:MAG TPA: hypothetical protein VJ576_16525 [Rhodocyclaceae bacterium]|nr:hypothetical protein [Rhodocyclaceae bacterium]
MQIKSQFQVVGAKSFKGDVEGKSYDSSTLFVLMDVSERGGNAVGQNVVEMKFGKSDEFDKLKHLPFPVQAELTLNLTTKGYEVEGFRAVSAQKPAAPQA